MRVVTLVENTKQEGRDDLTAEHGLSLYIEHKGQHILFDTGATDAFARNAEKLGVDLEIVEALVISHHHYDHGGGLARFLELNQKAKIYLRKSKEENFYFRALGIINKYIGLDQELLRKHTSRFEQIEGFTRILPGVFILTEIPRPYDLPRGNRKLFVKKGGTYEPDDFGHELILVMEERENLVVFTGCSHNGILNMMTAVTRQFPDKPIKAVFGGFHLIGLPILNTMAAGKSEVRAMGKELLKYPVERVYTGHCTGKKAHRVLKEVMAQTLEDFPAGRAIVL
ncbi:MAG: MBL fold metallo-hydrolase [Desulfobacula sp.]|nr:MBL fold metallo-hydrolase [Desulfobacula sp.]